MTKPQRVYEKVLVRNGYTDKWNISFFGAELPNGRYLCINGEFNYCIKFIGHENFVGTTTMPEADYIPKEGELVAVRNPEKSDCSWKARVFVKYEYAPNAYGYSCKSDNAWGGQEKWPECEELSKHFEVSSCTKE